VSTFFRTIHGGQTHKPDLKKPKDYGINTDPPHKAIIYSVSFWFFYPPCREMHIKFIYYAQASSYQFRQPFRYLPIHTAGSPSALAFVTLCVSALHPQVILSPSASFWH